MSSINPNGSPFFTFALVVRSVSSRLDTLADRSSWLSQSRLDRLTVHSAAQIPSPAVNARGFGNPVC
jgi:hypothetical protein